MAYNNSGNDNGGNGINRANLPATLNPQAQALVEMVKQGNPEIGRRVMEIILSRPANAQLSPARALQAALYEQRTGKVLGRDFYADEKMGNVDSYRGEQREAGTDYYTQPRPLTLDENTDHEVKEGDTAIAVEVYSPDMRARAQRVDVPYRPIVGIGIVRKGEKFKTRKWNKARDEWEDLTPDKYEPIDPPTGRSWRWKAEQRALKDGLRHLPGAAATVAEVLSMAEEEGLSVEVPEGARISLDQAETAMNRARIARDTVAQHVDLSSRPAGFDGYDTPAEGLQQEPPIEAEYSVRGGPEWNERLFDDQSAEAQAAAEFAAIPSAKEERATTPATVPTDADGKVQPAALKTTKFRPALKALCDRLAMDGLHTYDKNGGLDYDGVRFILAHHGIAQVTDGNLNECIALLDKRAREKAQA